VIAASPGFKNQVGVLFVTRRNRGKRSKVEARSQLAIQSDKEKGLKGEVVKGGGKMLGP